MKYQVDGWNNFCRVFEIPDQYPGGFCFGGGKPVNFQMVDWFNPVSIFALCRPAVSKVVWEKEVGPIKTIEVDLEELGKEIIPFLKKKTYIIPGKRYLILYDFGGSTVVDTKDLLFNKFADEVKK